MRTLIIGYGNENRRDDGVGRYVVAQLAQRTLPAGVVLETAHQLEVDLAETLPAYDRVFFVDAALPDCPTAWRRAEVVPGFQCHVVSHFLTPSDVLGLCQALTGSCPQGVLYSIRGYDFDFGSELSPATRDAAAEVIRHIQEELHS